MWHDKSNEIKKYKGSYWDFWSSYKNKYAYCSVVKFRYNGSVENDEQGTLVQTTLFCDF